MLLSEDIVHIAKSDAIYSLTFVVDEFSGLFLQPFYYGFKVCINNKWYFIRFLILIKF